MTVKSSATPQDSSAFWLSLATPPLLLSLVGIHTLTQNLIKLGETSEEIFRGERLPILNFPEPGAKS